jgi:cold-inducible RNA-binding protein
VGTKLYVGNLNYNTTEDSLREAFGSNGREVTSVSIIMDRETGRSRGFAFVEMSTSEFAQQALQELDGHELDGRMLRINEARERDARGPGGPPRSFSPRPAGGYGAGPGGPGGPGGPSGGYGRPPGPPMGAPPGGGPAGGGYGGRPSGPGFGAPPGPRPNNFGPPASPGGGADGRRRRNEREKEKERSGGDAPKKKRRNMGDDGDGW